MQFECEVHGPPVPGQAPGIVLEMGADTAACASSDVHHQWAVLIGITVSQHQHLVGDVLDAFIG